MIRWSNSRLSSDVKHMNLKTIKNVYNCFNFVKIKIIHNFCKQTEIYLISTLFFYFTQLFLRIHVGTVYLEIEEVQMPNKIKQTIILYFYLSFLSLLSFLFFVFIFSVPYFLLSFSISISISPSLFLFLPLSISLLISLSLTLSFSNSYSPFSVFLFLSLSFFTFLS